MLTINTTEFCRNLSGYLGQVEQGETILLTVHDRVVARLVPEGDPAEAALARIRAYRKHAAVGDLLAPVDLPGSDDLEQV